MDRAPLAVLVAVLVAMVAYARAQKPETGKPWAELSVVPRIAQSRQVVTFTLRLHGREEERYYCPAVEWTWTDGTRSREESDCEPFAERVVYPRVWSKRVLVIGGGQHSVTARLLKNGALLMKAEASVMVAGE